MLHVMNTMDSRTQMDRGRVEHKSSAVDDGLMRMTPVYRESRLESLFGYQVAKMHEDIQAQTSITEAFDVPIPFKRVEIIIYRMLGSCVVPCSV